MKLHFSLIFSLLLPLSLETWAQDCGPASLPDKILLKTPSESFTSEFYFALRCGKIWVKPYAKIQDWVTTPIDNGQWELFTGTGLPHDDDHTPIPDAVREISADGENLAAIDDHDRVYFIKTDRLNWHPNWGFPRRPTLLPANRIWAVAHRGRMEAGGYEDISGTFIPTGMGITTIYVVSEDGREIHFGDPWAPPSLMGHRLGLPLRGRFVIEHLSASASTVFVIDQHGRMFTRLADFDTLGSNITDHWPPYDPMLPWRERWQNWRVRMNGGCRTLPGEGWREQPMISDGLITGHITILQNGKGNSGDGRGFGNAGRELRVEGVRGNESGYFSKMIFDTEWHFVATGPASAIQGPFLSPVSASSEDGLAAPLDKSYTGKLDRVSIRLVNYSPRNEDASIEFSCRGETVKAYLYTRENHFGNPNGNAAMHFLANIQFPSKVSKLAPRCLRGTLTRFFGGKQETPHFHLDTKSDGTLRFEVTDFDTLAPEVIDFIPEN